MAFDEARRPDPGECHQLEKGRESKRRVGCWFIGLLVFAVLDDIVLVVVVGATARGDGVDNYAHTRNSESHEPVHSAMPSDETPKHDTRLSWPVVDAR